MTFSSALMVEEESFLVTAGGEVKLAACILELERRGRVPPAVSESERIFPPFPRVVILFKLRSTLAFNGGFTR